MSRSTLNDVVAALETLYDPAWAESWDAVGLVCGDPDQPVRRVLFAVDPTWAVVREAREWEADLVVTHHPLYLKGTTSVAASTPKGRVIHTLIRSGIALYTAHTNADNANPGVSDALARAVGLDGELTPLAPSPYGESLGIGRVGDLASPVTLARFAERAAAGLPATAAGLRVAGDPDREIRRVAVSGGAGDSLLGAARASGADVFLTADLRHHPASEFVEAGGPALVDAAHWATEWPWLGDAAALLTSRLAQRGINVETHVSSRVTDAWTTTAQRGMK